MRILVIGGTGMVGSEAVRRLARQDVPVSVMTHSPAKSRTLPAGVHGVVGDLRRPESLPAAFNGMERVFLITPLSETETEEGINAVRAGQQSGVARFVLLSVHKVEQAPHIPHFRSKIEIEKELRASGMPHTLIMPNNFFQNDLLLQQAIIQFGVYSQPIGALGVSRVDVRDIAEAAMHALLEEGHTGQRYPLVGPQVLTGEDCAETWSRHLGHPVRYGGDELEAWGEQVRPMFPAWLVQDLKTMYAEFHRHGLKATDADLKQQHRILHHEPRDYESFVAETARAWRSASAA